MKIDLTLLLEGKTSEVLIDYRFLPDGDAVRLPYGITLATPIHVTGKVKDNHGYLSLVASAEVQYKTECDRCLAPVTADLSYTIERLVGAKAGADDVLDEEDILPLENGAVDIDADIAEAFLLELPMRHLCKEDCPGLCPKCGKRLAEGDCSCKNEKEIDPRWKVLQKLLENPQ